MNLIKFLQQVTKELADRKISHALAGGVVASFYRSAPRATKDIDILIFAEGNSQKAAEALLRKFALQPRLLRQADLAGGPMFAIKKKSSPVCIVAGRGEGSGAIGLDLLLPTMPWADKAIGRAQSNRVDFGFGATPCLTKEDLIIAKLYALTNQSTRFMDLDDLQSIFAAHDDLDLEYLCGQMRSLELVVPEVLRPAVPKAVLLLTKC